MAHWDHSRVMRRVDMERETRWNEKDRKSKKRKTAKQSRKRNRGK